MNYRGIYEEKPEEIASMELQEEVNQMLCHSQRECLHLKGLIRKVKSAQALLMMRKDEAKKDLEAYFTKMSESLIDFRSEMHFSIRTEVERKNDKLTSLCKKYEENIKSYTELCDAGEKLMYFGKSLKSEEEKNKAKQLLCEFSQLKELSTDKDEICAVVKLEFYPALQSESIVPNMFGDLIIGNIAKSAKSLSVLGARSSRCNVEGSNNTNILDESKKHTISIDKNDQFTQTDNKVVEMSIQTENSENQGSHKDSVGCSAMQCDQQCVSYPQTSPPGFGHVAVPDYSHDPYQAVNPPPGFSVYQQANAPQPYHVVRVQRPSVQVHPYMITNNQIYQGSGYNPLYTTMTTPANSYQSQNTYLCSYKKPLSQDPPCFYPSKQQYVGVPFVSKSFEGSSHCSGNNLNKISNNSKTTVENNVSNIPLPIGPMPYENSVHVNSKMDIDIEQTADKDERTNVLVNGNREITCVNKNYSCSAEMETDKLVNQEVESFSEINKCQSDFQRFENLLKRTNELLESSHMSEVNEFKKTDDAVEVTIDEIIEDDLKNRDADRITNLNGDSIHDDLLESHNEERNKKLDNQVSEVDGQNLKVKLEKGKGIVTTMKPLRRPLRLPKKCLSHSKATSESKSDSFSSGDSGIIAEENSNDNSTKLTCALSSQLDTPLTAGENHSLVVKQEMLENIKSEISQEQNVASGTDKSHIEVKEESDFKGEPEIMDFSVSSGINMRDVVKNSGLSKSEVRELNKKTLQSQTKWLKGYLQQMLPENELKDIKLEMTDENNNSSGDSFAAMSDSLPELDSVPMDDATSSVIKDEQIQSDVSELAVSKSDEKKTQVEQGTSMTVQTDTENCLSKNSTTERKTDMRNLKSAVKGFLGVQRESNQRCTSTYSRLGALQAHWLKNSPGTSIKAKYLFSCQEALHFPIGVTTNSLQQIIVADTGNHCVKMFDQVGKFIRICKGHNMKRPSAIVVNEFDHIFVKDDVSIKVFDNLGDYIMNIDTDFTRPFGLVLTPSKCLLVLETDRNHPALVHISQDGSHVWRFPYMPLIKAPPGSKCRFMAVSENHVLVSDLGLSQIYITDLQGLSFKVIGMPGHDPQQFYEPSGISVDNYGNIVIGDSRNNRVQVFRHDGSFTGLIDFDEKIVRPSDIHLTSDNKLIVVNFIHHIIKVYQLLA